MKAAGSKSVQRANPSIHSKPVSGKETPPTRKDIWSMGNPDNMRPAWEMTGNSEAGLSKEITVRIRA